MYRNLPKFKVDFSGRELKTFYVVLLHPMTFNSSNEKFFKTCLYP